MVRRSLLLALAGLSAEASAQTSTPIDQNRVDRNPSATITPKPDSRTLGAAVRVDAAAAATPIRNIEFEGTAVPLVVARAAQPFIGKPASQATLQALAGTLSDAYGRSEVALFTIVIPEQDLTSGNVRVLVAEGHVEAVVLTGEVEGRKLRLVRHYADRLTRGRPTSRRTLERYLSLIQDIPGLKVSPQLQLGEAAGGVRLILALDYQRPTLTFGFDNRTTRLVRDGQFSGAARAYGLFREGDETQLSGVASVNFKDQLYFGAAHSTPMSRDGTRLSANVGLLRTRPVGTGVTGKAHAAGVTVSHPLIRSYRRNLTLSLAVDGLNSKNAAFGSLISTEKSRAVRGAAAFAQASQRRAVSASLTASRGLDILGASVPAAIGDATFLKFNARAGFDQVIGRRGVLRLRSSAQWTRDPLPAVERFSIGGAEFGRAFEVGLLNTDRGVAGLAELAWRPIRSGKLAPTELYAFADGASARLLARPGVGAQSFDLASAGAGTRLAWTDRAMLELEAARTLDRPFHGYDSDWRFSVSWKLSLRP